MGQLQLENAYHWRVFGTIAGQEHFLFDSYGDRESAEREAYSAARHDGVFLERVKLKRSIN